MSTKSNFTQTLSFALLVQQVKRYLLFVLSFGGMKINALSAALLLSNFFPAFEDFGRFEYALSIGILLSVPLNMGLQAAIPYFLIKQKRSNYYSVYYFHGLLILGMFIFAFLVYWYANGLSTSTLSLATTITVVFSLQILASTISKTEEKIYKAIFLDGVFFLLLNLYNVYLFVYGVQAELHSIQLLLLLQVFFLAIYYVKYFVYSYSDFRWEAYLESTAFGRPIIIGTFLVLGLTGFGRILAGNLFDLSSVALYGIYFRLAAVIVMVHQVINIAFFKKIYASSSKVLDQWFERFLLLIILLSLVSYLIVPSIATNLFSIVRESWDASNALYIVLNFQMFFWICLSLMENIIVRENLASIFNKLLAPLFFVMLLMLYISHAAEVLSLSGMVMINSCCIYLGVEIQLSLLKKRGSYFPKTSRIIRLVFAFQLLYFILQN